MEVSVFPMHVGVIPNLSVTGRAYERIPHACGGDPAEVHRKPTRKLGIPHACGGDPISAHCRHTTNAYSPCMWG